MKNKVRVGHYMPQYGTNTGTGQVLKKLINFFKGHNNIEFFVFKYGEKFNIEKDENITIISFSPNFSKWIPPFKFLQSIRKNQYSIDFLGIHMPFSTQNFITYLFSSVPLDYYPHGCFNPKTLKRSKKKYKKFIYLKIIESKILKTSRRLICATEKESNYMSEVGFRKSVVAPFPFDFPVINNTPLNFRTKYNLLPSEFIVVFVGRFDIFTKGLDILIKSVKKVHSKHPLVKAVLIGYNYKKPFELDDLILKYGCQNCIINAGPLYGDDKYDAILSSNLYVQASRYESFGVSILEALYLKVPCLISTGCDLTSSIYKSKGCFKFDGSINSLIREILKIYEDYSKSKEIASNGFKWLKSNLGKRNLLKNWESIFTQS